MLLGINPTVDFAFKLLFGSPEHMAITIHFLNALLGTRITTIEILNPILDKESDDDKLAILDILAIDEHGRRFNIEMQTSLPAGLSQRLVYYASSLYVGQLTAGENYSLLRPAISICVLDKLLFPRHERLHSEFLLRDKNGEILTEDLQIHTVELPKLRVSEHNIGTATLLKKWVFLLLNADKYEVVRLRELLPEAEFQEAIGVLEMIAKTPEQRDQYEARLKLQRDEAARLEYARLEGEQIGMEKGEQIGVQKGKVQLLEQLLGLPESTGEDLAKMTPDQLANKVEELQRQLRGRIPPE